MPNARILVVEDEAIVALDITERLEAMNYTVAAVVATGEQAIAECGAREVEVVLMDIRLDGEMDGIQAAAEIRRRFDLPIVYLTANTDDRTTERAIHTEPFGYILKPFAGRELRTVIEMALYKHRTERKLKEQERWLAATLASIGDAVITVDTDQRITFINPVAAALTGWQDEAARGRDLREIFRIVNEETRREVENPVARVLKEGAIVGLANHTILIARDGIERPIDDSAAPIIDEQGQVHGVVLVFRDVTERRQAQVALRESERRFKALFDHAKDAIMLADDNARYVGVNAATCELLGYTRDELLDMTAWDVTPAGGQQRSLELWQEFIKAGRLSGEYTLARQDGSQVEIEYNSVANVLPGLHMTINRDISARKQSERALRESEGRYRNIIDNAPLVLFTIDKAGVFTQSEGKGLAAAGLKSSEMVGQSAFALYGALEVQAHTGDLMKGAEVIRRVFAGETISGVTHLFDSYYENSFIPLRDAGGEVVGMMGVAFDITEIRRAEDARRSSEERFRAMIEYGSDIISMHDVQGAMLYQSPSIKRILGYEQNELLGKNVLDYIHPEERQKTALEIEKVRSSPGVHPSFETRFLHKGGSWVCVECTGTNLLDNPAVGKILFNARDITGRRHAEATLRLRDRAVAAVSEGIIITDPHQPDNPIIFANAGFTGMTGYTLEEVRGHNCRLLQGAETDQASIEEIRTAVRDGKPCAVEILNYRKDGTPFWNSLSISPVHDEVGRVTHFVGVQQDITARKLAEEKLRQVEEQLRQAQKLESIGLLAGGIAHDFNNMLTAINGYSDLILRQLGENDPMRQRVEVIRKAGSRASTLTYQLLAFSRRQILEPKVFSINEIVSETCKMLQRLIGADVDLTMVLNSKLGQVEADPGQISQVLTNLIMNARDAMPLGGKLTVETENIYLDEKHASRHVAVDPGRYVMLAVSDTGTGMDEATQKRIFEPFFTTKEVGKGTGMGLATVYGIVKQSRGNIWVYSEAGRGTTLKIYLPRVDREAEDIETEAADDDLPAGTEKILLVEDEEIVRDLTKRILEMCGYTVLDAANGAVAAKLCEDEGCDVELLITDVIMPQMGGRELVARLTPSHPAMRVLYISGYTNNAIVHHGVLDAGTNFIQKPFTPEALAKKVREVLDS